MIHHAAAAAFDSRRPAPAGKGSDKAMRLPGTRYQEHGWEGVRKLLGLCSLAALRTCDVDAVLEPARHGALLDDYMEALAPLLHAAARHGGTAPGNSYGDSVADLALGLLFELALQPGHWSAFANALAAEHGKQGPFWREAHGDALLRKKVNDLYATLRDKLDADNFQAATGQACSPNRIYTYRMLDTACRAIEAVFAGWPGTAAQVGAILGRDVPSSGSYPIEIRQMKSTAACRPEWIVRWSETLERFGAGPGPLHTRSKRFASLRNNAGKIGAMLADIAAYEELSANGDGADWVHDAGTAAQWLDDLTRVSAQSAAAASTAPDRILPPPGDDGYAGHEAVCPAPGYAPAMAYELALAALQAEALPVRQAVCLKLLGPGDDSYPDDWRDSATSELPTLQQLAAQAGLSVPTLRKRRDAAIARARPEGEQR